MRFPARRIDAMGATGRLYMVEHMFGSHNTRDAHIFKSDERPHLAARPATGEKRPEAAEPGLENVCVP